MKFTKKLIDRLGLSTFLQLSLLFLMSGSFFLNCAGNTDKLTGLMEPKFVEAKFSGLTADFCNTAPFGANSRLKLLFIMDKTGSNAAFDTTDPKGLRRWPAILNYVQSELDPMDATKFLDPNLFLGLMTFNRDNIQIDSQFTQDPVQFAGVVQAAWEREDVGGTPYTDTLIKARSMIQADINRSKEDPDSPPSSYVIFFISDGEPSPYEQPESIFAEVNNFLVMEDQNEDVVDQIILHTGFYTARTLGDPQDASKRQLLEQMAVAGKGRFEIFVENQNLDFNLYEIPSSETRYTLDDIFIQNLNATWDNDGVLRWDSDSDGLSDWFESLLGSDPFLYDSDGNEVNDKVEFETKGKPCKDVNCSPALANKYEYSVCSTLVSLTPGSIYKDYDNDFLNDCEEELLKTERNRIDSNSDTIPDILGFVKNVAIKKGTNTSNIDSDNDGVINYDEIKNGTPTNYNNEQILGLKEQKYSMSSSFSNASQMCFDLTVEEIAYLSFNDKIRIYVMESDITGRVKMRTYDQIIGANGVVDFNF